MLDEQALGDLELELRGSTPSSSAIARSARGEARRAELHGERLTAMLRSRPEPRHRAGVAEASRPSSSITPHSSAIGMKLARRDRARASDAPSAPGLRRRITLPRLPMIGWIVEIGALAVAQLAAQRGFDLVAALDVGVHRLGEDAEAVAARRLGAVHGDVGLAQQLGGFGDFLAGEDARRCETPTRASRSPMMNGLADHRDDPLAEAADVGLALAG